MTESYNPSRMELLRTKNRIKLGRKGHKLLKQKRDFLVMEFLNMLEETKLHRKVLSEKMRKSYVALALAQSYHSILELESSAMSVLRVGAVEVRERNLMGVRVPVIKKYTAAAEIGRRGYSIIESSAKMDEVSGRFKDALDSIIQIAESEISIRKMVLEIEKTKRRVNALEYGVMPGLSRKKADIEFRLDEMERENFVTLKSLKDRLSRTGNGVF